jgi:hypothetical protein
MALGVPGFRNPSLSLLRVVQIGVTETKFRAIGLGEGVPAQNKEIHKSKSAKV